MPTGAFPSTFTPVFPAAAAAATGGGWSGLMAILADARQIASEEASRPPTACPNDGMPLENVNGVLHCRFDGWSDRLGWGG